MRMRYLAAVLAAVMSLPAAPAAAAVNDRAVLAANGIDADKLAPGWKVSGDRVVWPAATLYLRGHGLELCELAVELCLYEADNYNNGPYDLNKKVEIFNGHYPGRYDLASYGFDNIMSSWYNPSARNARWWYGFNNTGTSRCMSGRSGKNPKVGIPDNDQASSVTIYSSLDTCGDL
ncbi:peptidase inhibitor family I36 protein [Fodinicola acaciae]|uniref:peptidase inhibitor family I36 protein n=1 Tax=Fodinicola acaciae TaxID=2681555 RepID=UPI0013D66FA8|nr:peptidase inhibitor family I36 protein [Fodinicola acaciae]